MNFGILLTASAGYFALLFLVYLGVTRISEFKKLPEEKQLAGKKRLITALIICAAVGLYQVFVKFN